ncbi:MAG: N-methyl-D-aspartate receptor NMDAR2C subunit [Verrucomicrobiota bacterium]
MEAANEKQWRNFWQSLGAQGDPAPPWQRLHSAYTEAGRSYHNLQHIDHCLTEFAGVRNLAEDAGAIEAAIWFHDVIYDTRGKDNEERSADVAVSVLTTAGLPEAFRQGVGALILTTKHNQPPTNKDAALLVDIDLSILGQSSERYADFERQIRSEYAWVSQSDFAVGRAAILKSFLGRKNIFVNEQFARRYEQQARDNIAWALDRLVG